MSRIVISGCSAVFRDGVPVVHPAVLRFLNAANFRVGGSGGEQTKAMPKLMFFIAIGLTIAYGCTGKRAADSQPAVRNGGNDVEKKVPLVFSGGHETDPRDHGRPVVLVAAGLDVTPEVFREAFSGVRPARGRGPTREEARRNKEALMEVLGPHKVTNKRLDDVSDYYRYRPEKGEMWPTSAAEAYAVVEDGKIKRIVVTKGGSGYSSPPKATVKGFENVRLEPKVEFAKNLKRNGAVASVTVVPTVELQEVGVRNKK